MYWSSILGYLLRISCTIEKLVLQLLLHISCKDNLYNALGDDFPFIHSGSSSLFPLQILLRIPYPQVLQQPPEQLVQAVTFPVVCGVWTTRAKSGHRESTGSPGSVMVRAVEEEQWESFGFPSAPVHSCVSIVLFVYRSATSVC